MDYILCFFFFLFYCHASFDGSSINAITLNTWESGNVGFSSLFAHARLLSAHKSASSACIHELDALFPCWQVPGRSRPASFTNQFDPDIRLNMMLDHTAVLLNVVASVGLRHIIVFYKWSE